MEEFIEDAVFTLDNSPMKADLSSNMRQDFADRDELIAYVREQFPSAASRDPAISSTVGGRQAAQTALSKVDPTTYAQTRNFLKGAVTRLSPYLRYGVLSLTEVRDAVLRKVPHPSEVTKLINELAWRDYWQRLYTKLGDDIWQDQEPYKTGLALDDYTEALPPDIEAGTTSMVCIDHFSQELHQTGYLHNHARMWLAAYIVHWRHIRWQAGAHWFLQHLLDGDPASNNLSWQWVASTFSTKPYFFNRENLERHTEGVYCCQCPLYGHCAFEGSYDELAERLFPQANFREANPTRSKGEQHYQQRRRANRR